MTYPIFDYPLLIRESHLDTFGHVNNATYLAIFEEARWELMNAAGIGIKTIQQTGIAPTILEFHVVYKRELHARTCINVRTQLESFDRKVGVLKQWMEDEAGQLCCDASMKFGIFDLKTRRLIVPPPEWIVAFGGPSLPA